jgi:alkanesulfonate monooxygenase SsuD/methylene tetrahydromethanopterin reductase-like flavin-dependent oxidoreductase (luciferase family)
MRKGIEIVNLGEYADPRPLVALARTAEEAGWEALCVWDHLGFVWGAPSGDPWIALAAVAAVTTRLKLCVAVAPLPRYRPHVLAQALTTLDRLSDGRMVLGAGLGGVAAEYSAFGESSDPKHLASMLDEGLDVISRLWSGRHVTHRGAHYTIEGLTLAPLPLQQPRIPIWIGGESRPALRRAARWDGWIIGGVNQDGTMNRTPEQLAAKVAALRQLRADTTPFEVAMTGYSTPGDDRLVGEFASAGVTWWLESLHGSRGSHEELLARVAAGPPRS